MCARAVCCRFLPAYCPEGVRVVVDEWCLVEVVPNAKGKQDRRLDLAQWQIAWDRCALAMAMLEMIPYSAAMQHKQVVLEMAIGHSEEHRPALGVVYDELVRKEWGNKSGKSCVVWRS